MIVIFFAKENYGIFFRKQTIYTEITTKQKRFRELLELIPYGSEVRLVKDVKTSNQHVEFLCKDLKFKIGPEPLSKGSLDIQEEIESLLRDPQLKKRTKLGIRLGTIFSGIIAGLIVLNVTMFNPYVRVRTTLIEQHRHSTASALELNDMSLDLRDFIQEVNFLYANPVIQSVLVNDDGTFTIIFLSQATGLSGLQKQFARDTQLSEGNTVTLDGQIHSIYTLEGVMR